jgi:hypothetical protein
VQKSNSVPVQHEARSPDSVHGRITDANGFERDDFCTSDGHGSSLSFTSDTSSTDDDSCTTASDGGNSVESKRQRATRLDIIAKAMCKVKSASSTDKAPLRMSASGHELASLRSRDIKVKRRTPRTPVIELILNKWLHSDVSEISVDHVAEFLRLLKMVQPEYAISIYYCLIKRIRPLSSSLFKFLYRCIIEYLPDHKRCLVHAFRNVVDKEVKEARKSPSVPISKPLEFDRPAVKIRPTLRPPTLNDITDIAAVVGKFHNEYRAYVRDHQGNACRSMFQCLSPDQAVSFAAIVMQPEAILDKMDEEELLEVWRTCFGLQSSASVLSALSSMQFKGDVLSIASWAEWHRRVVLMTKQAPAAKLPPGKILAKRFIMGCPSAFVRDDLLAMEASCVDTALHLVICRLKDHGFIRAASAVLSQGIEEQQTASNTWLRAISRQ